MFGLPADALLNCLYGGDFIHPENRDLVRKEARHQLKDHTGQDFGYDIEAWSSWLDDNPEVYDRINGVGPDSTFSAVARRSIQASL